MHVSWSRSKHMRGFALARVDLFEKVLRNSRGEAVEPKAASVSSETLC